jgi:hypothetical protein
VALHERHSPSQLESQQTPSTQKPLTHSVPVEQNAALGFFPQLPMTHGPLALHSADVVHEGKHAATPGLQANGAQIVSGPGRQLPMPSHTLPPRRVLPSQRPLAAPQLVPAG